MKLENGTVTVEVKDASGELKEASKTYEKQTFENLQDILSEAQKGEASLKKILSDLNYGWDLKARAKVRAQILSENQGPEKNYEKMAKEMVKIFAGFGITMSEADALAKVKADIEKAKNESAA